jgi:signal transduction histidine kinase
LLITLWTISTILIIADPKSESTRWLAAIGFFSGLGGLAVVIRFNLIPYLQANITKNAVIIGMLYLLCGLSASLSHYIAPYSLLVYSIVHSNIFRGKWQSIRYKVLGLLMLPPLVMYCMYPIYPLFKTSYPMLSIWVTLYVMTANLLLVYSYVHTKDPKVKQQKLLTCVIVTPGTLISLMTNYILRAFDINNAFYYNVFIILIQFGAFIFFSIQQGALGVRLSIEKSSMDRTMKALTSGTAILNHTIKNEVLKISMCMKNIEHYTVRTDSNMQGMDEVFENIRIVNDATNYLSVMINKIQNQVKNVELQEASYCFSSIIDRAIDMVMPFAREKNITITKTLTCDINIMCDGVHLQEVLKNVFNNSIEAIVRDGEIVIGAAREKKHVVITIKDNGNGISKENLPHIIDPFFSTKHRTQNFGLGLSYCYTVMRQHGGLLEIQSEEGKGTTVLLNLPAKRICAETNLSMNIRGVRANG